MVFRWSLSDSKSPHVSKTLLSILADLSNAVVWVVSARPRISTYSRSFTNSLVTVPSSLFIIGNTVTFMIHNFFGFLARSKYMYLFSFSLIYTLWSAEMAKSTIRKVIFFCHLSLGLVFWPGLGDPLVSQNLREFCVYHSTSRILVYAYTIW